MKENQKNTKKAIGTVIAATGIACVSSLMGGKIIEGVLGGIAGNLASSYIEKLELKKVKDLILGGPQPEELNHDLKKTLEKAILWSIENIEILYKEEILNDKEINVLGQTIELLKKDVSLHFKHLYLEEEKIIKHIDASSSDFYAMADDLDIIYEQLPEISNKIPFRDFFKTQFPPQLQLCFGELIKKEENQSAWIAYQRYLYQSSQRYFTKLKAQNEEILIELRKPKLNQSLFLDLKTVDSQLGKYSFEQLNPQIQSSLDLYTISLKNDQKLILRELKEGKKLTEKIGRDTHQTKEIVKDINQTLHKEWMPKKKVAFLSAVSLFSIALFSFWYYKANSDFSLTAYVNASSDLNISDAYPPPDYPIEFKISLPNRMIDEVVYDNNKLILNVIDGKYIDSKVKISMNDPYWRLVEDSLILKKDLIEIWIEPNGALSEVKGVVRGLNNQFLVNATVQVGTDTLLITDELGRVEARLPIPIQKEWHQLKISAPGYKPGAIEYYPNVSEFDLRLEPSNN